MRITTLSGHLTATNKKHIKIMFNAGLNTSKVNRINYEIRIENDFYVVKTATKDSNYSNGYLTSKATFKIN